jgi:hypothetical protein
MSLEHQLENLHAAYVGAVNAAVATDDLASVDRLAREYEDEALALVLEMSHAA